MKKKQSESLKALKSEKRASCNQDFSFSLLIVL